MPIVQNPRGHYANPKVECENYGNHYGMEHARYRQAIMQHSAACLEILAHPTKLTQFPHRHLYQAQWPGPGKFHNTLDSTITALQLKR